MLADFSLDLQKGLVLLEMAVFHHSLTKAKRVETGTCDKNNLSLYHKIPKYG